MLSRRKNLTSCIFSQLAIDGLIQLGYLVFQLRIIEGATYYQTLSNFVILFVVFPLSVVIQPNRLLS